MDKLNEVNNNKLHDDKVETGSIGDDNSFDVSPETVIYICGNYISMDKFSDYNIVMMIKSMMKMENMTMWHVINMTVTLKIVVCHLRNIN